MRTRNADGTYSYENTVTYSGAHDRVRRLRGPADRCIFGCIARRYEWANLTGDYPNVNDYAQMCGTCHNRYDQARKSMEPGFTTVHGWPLEIRSNAMPPAVAAVVSEAAHSL